MIDPLPMKTLSVRMIQATLLAAAVATALTASPISGARMKEIDKKIDVLLRRMTIEEKVGQMTQVTIDMVSVGPDGRREPHAIDPAKLEEAVLKYHVGSILNVGPAGYPVDHWREVITQIQDCAKKSRLGIPILYGIDAIHGATYTDGATLFPQPIGLAATWNTDIARGVGDVTALEIRASGIPWNFSPNLDLGRQPLWSRLWESYGEDVNLAIAISGAYIDGMMGTDMSAPTKVAPCVKHYVGYGYPFNGKDRTPAWIDERMMRQYFLPPFEAAVRAGVPTVMANSSEVNGIPGHANYHLLTEVLKNEWGFQGFIDSDWRDIENLHTRDHVASTPKEAVRMAVMAGVDMSMVPLDYSFYDLLLQLVKEKAVPVSRIDDAVRRILRVKYLVGLFDTPYPDAALASKFATPENTEFNRTVARESITLLKNDSSLLPLKKDARVLITGPTANLLSSLNGGWTITWQGNEDDRYPKNKPTILKGIQEAIGKEHVVYRPGTTFDAPLDIPSAVAAAETADVVIACLGEKAYCETPGNINDLTLDDAQLSLVEALAKTHTPIVLVLAEGRPRLIHRIVNHATAIVLAYLPGIEGGRAIADILFGDTVPSGKLPFSYPKFPNAITMYDHKPIEVADVNAYDPEFPFGYGLSYTTFEYSDLSLSATTLPRTGSITVTVHVKNTGSRPGKEVVQLYGRQLYRTISPPMRELKAFRKVAIQPGETVAVSFTLAPKDFEFVGLKNTRVIEPGACQLFVGPLSQGFELK